MSSNEQNNNNNNNHYDIIEEISKDGTKTKKTSLVSNNPDGTTIYTNKITTSKKTNNIDMNQPISKLEMFNIEAEEGDLTYINALKLKNKLAVLKPNNEFICYIKLKDFEKILNMIEETIEDSFERVFYGIYSGNEITEIMQSIVTKLDKKNIERKNKENLNKIKENEKNENNNVENKINKNFNNTNNKKDIIRNNSKNSIITSKNKSKKKQNKNLKINIYKNNENNKQPIKENNIKKLELEKMREKILKREEKEEKNK